MKIETVDFFYLSMPEVTDAGDGSQDALIVRVTAGGHVGWGECEASPLVSIASAVCPMSHGACRPVLASVLGQRLDGVDDIPRITAEVKANGLDLLQTDHTWSGVEIALWDLLGRRFGEPVWRLLGWDRAHPKRPYASQLFGDDSAATLAKGKRSRTLGFTAVKFGWGPFGRGTVAQDRDQLQAAREGLGPDGILLVDVGTVWGDDVDAGRARLPMLEEARALWLEEPFLSGAHDAYATLAAESPKVRMAGGEGCHDIHMARHMIDRCGLGFVQIDAGRIGGLGPAVAIARYAAPRGVRYVNHTFTSNLALSASLQPFAGLADHEICEYPVELSPLATSITREHLDVGPDGLVRVPDAPGLGVTIDTEAAAAYLVDVEIKAKGRVLYRTPDLRAA